MGCVEYFYSEKEALEFAKIVRESEVKFCGKDDEGYDTWEVYYKPNDYVKK